MILCSRTSRPVFWGDLNLINTSSYEVLLCSPFTFDIVDGVLARRGRAVEAQSLGR